MPAKVSGANRRAELQRTKDHEEQPGKNMNQGENRMPRKHLIEGCKLSGSGVRDYRRRSVKVEGNRNEDDDSADGDRNPNHREKNDRAPQRSSEANPRFHTLYYVEPVRSLSDGSTHTKQSWPARVLLAKCAVIT